MNRVEPIPVGMPTFLGAPRCEDLDTIDADIAVFGVMGGAPYDMEGSTFPAGGATKTIR